MPEIAEVESVARVLDSKYIGKKLIKIETYPEIHQKGLPRLIKSDNFNTIENNKIVCFSRLGKNIIAKFDNNLNLAIHLMMSGVLAIENTLKNEKHLYVKLFFENSPYLAFLDPRRFGKMIIYNDLELNKLVKGIDAINGNLTPEILLELFKNNSEIKVFLLEKQDKIVGIGNIYACEILWHAKINPTKICNKITFDEAAKLCESIKFILNRAVENGGSTLCDKGYFLPDGTFGGAQNFHQVYAKQICSCGGNINKIIQKTRATFYCPKCQNNH